MIVIVLPDVAQERQLLHDASRKSQSAQKEIYEQYFSPIYNFIRLRVNDREQARDIAADVFLDFFIALNKPNPPRTSLRAWLFRVARNKIYDYYGHKKQISSETLEEWIPASQEHNPESQFLHDYTLERTRRVLGMLADDQREVLILRFGQELSLQETADLMDRSVSAVKSLQFRAVDRLRDLLNVKED